MRWRAVSASPAPRAASQFLQLLRAQEGEGEEEEEVVVVAGFSPLSAPDP